MNCPSFPESINRFAAVSIDWFYYKLKQMQTDQILAVMMIAALILFAGYALSRVDTCRQQGNKTILCAIGFE